MRSIKEECLNRMIFFGEKSLRNAVNTFCLHYHEERNHQGLANKLIEPGEEVGCTEGTVACRERLGGMLKYYYQRCRLSQRRFRSWPGHRTQSRFSPTNKNT